MESLSLYAIADKHLETARSSNSGRSAQTIQGDHDHMLRQTLMALVAGRDMAEHESPGQATLQVLRGRVRIRAGDDEWSGGEGDFVEIPSTRHSLHADEDSVVLLTVLADSRDAK